MNERIEELMSIICEGENSIQRKEVENYINNLQSKIDKAIEYIEKDTRWFDSEYASVYGELCDCEGYNANRLEVMVNPSNLLKILKEDK